jgi:hypothetical protein
VTDTAFSSPTAGNFRRGWLGQGARPVLPPDLATFEQAIACFNSDDYKNAAAFRRDGAAGGAEIAFSPVSKISPKMDLFQTKFVAIYIAA